MAVPLIVAGVLIYGMIKNVDIFSSFCDGAKENAKVAVGLLPTLCGVMLSVGMLKESGVITWIVDLLSPVCSKIGLPAGVLPLALLRPVSGSGALGILEQIYKDYHPDSFAGRVASVMMGSTETTFYTLAVYFGATKVRKTGCALWASLVGDVVCVAASVMIVRLFFT